MAFCTQGIRGVVFLAAAAAWGQNIVQPGAPGTANKILTPATAATPSRGPTDADTSFMQGMIMHHSQAVDMTDLMPARTSNKALLALGKRISISQTDEIQFMRGWLRDRGKAWEGLMPGMDHSKMSGPMLMPGMLTAEQMRALAKAHGKIFDRLFLTGMIQHHNGALIMVKDLMDTPGAGQDSILFDFTTDIDNTQRAEIEIMKAMLKEKK